MNWFLIVLITILVYEFICTLILIFADNEEITIHWACGLVYLSMKIILYPYKAIKNYNDCNTFYKNNNISRVQYLFGKRSK